jgi:hypothetical protein
MQWYKSKLERTPSVSELDQDKHEKVFLKQAQTIIRLRNRGPVFESRDGIMFLGFISSNAVVCNRLM